MNTQRFSSPLRAAKQVFWNCITKLYDRHYGTVTGAPEPEIEVYPPVHYVIAEAGFPNYGDELIAREWLKYLAQVDPDTPVVVDCLCSGPAAALFYECHPRVSVVDTTAQLALLARNALEAEAAAAAGTADAANESVPEVSVDAIAERVVDALDHEGVAARYAAGLRILTRHTRDMHVIGGGYLNSMWKGNLARLITPQWTQQHGIPSLVSGVGLEPLTDHDAQFCSDIARTLLSFTCRDEKSCSDLNKGGQVATLAPDDCFVNGLDGVYVPEAATGDLPDYMTCVQADLIDDKAALLDYMMRVLEHWNVPAGSRVGVVECIPYDSMDLITALREHGYVPQLFPLQEMIEFGFPARPGQTWLSTRYHPHLLASALGCRGSYISVKPEYYDIKHGAVLRMGSRWTKCVIGSDEIPQPGPGFADLNARYQYRDQIRAQVSPIYGELPTENQ